MALINPQSPDGHSAWDYAQTFVNLLDEIKKAVEDGSGNDPVSRRIPFNIRCDASGNGQEEIRLPRGTNWQLNGIAFTASASGYVATYVNEEASGSLLKVNASSLIVSDDFSTTEVTTDDGLILIVARAQTALTVVSGNLRIQQYEVSNNEPRSAL